MTSEIQPDRLEPSWPAILGQLGREKFRLDVSQLSAKEFDLIHQCRAGCRRQVEKDLAMSGPIRPWIVEVCERGLRCREASQKPVPIDGALLDGRSEERRVGKECRSRGSACQYKKQQNRLMRLLMAS